MTELRKHQTFGSQKHFQSLLDLLLRAMLESSVKGISEIVKPLFTQFAFSHARKLFIDCGRQSFVIPDRHLLLRKHSIDHYLCLVGADKALRLK